MSKFFVGQRVRLARPVVPGNAGAEGFITHIGSYAENDRLPNGFLAQKGMDCMVRWDRSLDLLIISIDWTGCRLAQLEPILPDGHRAGEEGKCELLDELLERQREAA